MSSGLSVLWINSGLSRRWTHKSSKTTSIHHQHPALGQVGLLHHQHHQHHHCHRHLLLRSKHSFFRNQLTRGSDIGRACSQLPNLSKISARHNSIEALSPDDVQACSGLDQLDLSYNRIAVLTGAFDGLTNLAKLGMIGNELACIDMEALDSLYRVREVEFDLRYLACTCTNNFVRDWSLQRRAKVVNYNCQTVTGSCLSTSSPPALACPTSPPCPEGCSCKVWQESHFHQSTLKTYSITAFESISPHHLGISFCPPPCL